MENNQSVTVLSASIGSGHSLPLFLEAFHAEKEKTGTYSIYVPNRKNPATLELGDKYCRANVPRLN